MCLFDHFNTHHFQAHNYTFTKINVKVAHLCAAHRWRVWHFVKNDSRRKSSETLSDRGSQFPGSLFDTLGWITWQLFMLMSVRTSTALWLQQRVKSAGCQLTCYLHYWQIMQVYVRYGCCLETCHSQGRASIITLRLAGLILNFNFF